VLGTAYGPKREKASMGFRKFYSITKSLRVFTVNQTLSGLQIRAGDVAKTGR
jgi:hypothetical protein